MSNRKDSKGRVLKKGESERKDGIYQYRYTDIRGKRQTVYSSDLKELREKEKEIQKQIDDGIDYAAGEITVIELLERYISLKQGMRYNTRISYGSILNLVRKEEFGHRQIRSIKVSDAQKWFMKLQEDGKSYKTILVVRGVVSPAFQMAYNEDAIRRNPFDFRISDVVANDTKKRVAMTDEQQKIWLNFVKGDAVYKKYYDEFVVLMGTGMRVSEFCGLTMSDIDFAENRIRIDHQLLRRYGKYFIEKPKTECGCRYIPMTDEVSQSLRNIINNRKPANPEVIVDGYGGFLLLDRKGDPKVACNIESEIRSIMKKYKASNPDKPLPHITPHVLRHTFCTSMANAGMDIKALQYIMGHSSAGITLNTYAHVSYEHAAGQMSKIINFDGTSTAMREQAI